jgi:hypothetical protein
MAAVGIYRQDAELLDKGVNMMSQNYKRVEMCNWIKDLNIPAIAMMKYAIRIGLKINIPASLKEHEELIITIDTPSTIAGYCLYPTVRDGVTSSNLKTYLSLLFDK